jgi:hypothetical protein
MIILTFVALVSVAPDTSCAKQSRKVTVLAGQNTYGMLDFSNVRTASLPSGERTIGLPMMRIIRDRSLNNVGVAPDVVVPPSDTGDALAFARRYLRTHPRDAIQGSIRRPPDERSASRSRFAGPDVTKITFGNSGDSNARTEVARCLISLPTKQRNQTRRLGR